MLTNMVVHFICRGNALRSIIAEAYLKSLNFPNISVLSSGTVASAYKKLNIVTYQNTLSLLEKHGIKQFAKDHYADDTEQSTLDKSDIVIFLNEIAHREAADSFDLPKKYYVWNVADIGEEGRIPATETERGALFEDVYAEIVNNIEEFLVSTYTDWESSNKNI